MKTYIKIFLIILSIASVSCRKEHSAPGISTLDVTEITATSAVCGGELESLDNAGFLKITWWTEQDTEKKSINVDKKNEIRFYCEITDLTPNTKYYVQAQVTASYVSPGARASNTGAIKEFTTLAE